MDGPTKWGVESRSTRLKINKDKQILKKISERWMSSIFFVSETIFSHDSIPGFVGRSIHLSVSPSVRLSDLTFFYCGLWPHCCGSNDQVTSNTAPAHPPVTGVAVYHIWPCFNYILIERDGSYCISAWNYQVINPSFTYLCLYERWTT